MAWFLHPWQGPNACAPSMKPSESPPTDNASPQLSPPDPGKQHPALPTGCLSSMLLPSAISSAYRAPIAVFRPAIAFVHAGAHAAHTYDLLRA